MFEEKGIKELLQKNLENSEESLKILQKMRRAAIMGRFFLVLKWALIIGLSVGAYYYIEPYLQALMNSYNAVNDLNQSNIPPELLEKLKNLLPK